MIALLAALFAGVAIGFLSGLFGVGGGVFAISALASVGISQQLAQGTSLVMVLPNLLIAMVQYGRRGSIALVPSILMGLCSIPGTYFAAGVASQLSSTSSRRWFAVFLTAMGSYALWSAFRRQSQAIAILNRPAAAALGVVAGLFTGFFGVGGGAIATPTLSIVFGMSQAEAQGVALALILPGALVGLLRTRTREMSIGWLVSR